MIYGERIRQAREFSGLTQTQLANAVGVKQSAISEIEYNEFAPSDSLLEKIANQTGFLPSFFELEPSDNLSCGTLNYRARRSATAREETRVYQYANILYQQVKRVCLDVFMPANKLPQLQSTSIKKAVRITRDELGLTQNEPIKKLIRTIENNGVIVLNIPRNMPKIDAFSTWAKLDEERPIIALLAGRPMDRIRFSIAHELGHLVLHQSIRPSLKIVENEANEFASAFLLPEQAMHEELKPPVTLTALAKLKLRWGVSMQALIMRAYNLRIITQRQAKYLFSQMSAQGWRTREPSNLDLKIELPHLVRNMIESKYRTREDYALGERVNIDTATELYAYA
jgi:Zn-dependent peptidase ImmA (M78 family)/transcriptional regulator with XRE-family HTH domain